MATHIRDLQKRANLPAKQAGGNTVAEFFEANKQAIIAVAPKHITPDRLLKIALQAIRNTPLLQECSAKSLMGAIVQCGEMGIEPNTVLGHGYLVPFRNRRKGTTEVQVIIGYKGLIDLARRSGRIDSISAHAVCANDDFDIELGTEDRIQHKPYLGGDRGEIIGFYAVAKMKDGGYQFEFMSRHQVEQVRDGSQGYQSAIRYKKDHPWITHFEPMGRKTVIRRLAKYLPLSVEFATAAALDGMAEGGQAQNLGSILDGEYTHAVTQDDDAPPPDIDEPEQSNSETDKEPADRPDAPWPQSFTDDETGETTWTDANGEFYEPDKHAWSHKHNAPAVNKDATFRARRNRDGAHTSNATPDTAPPDEAISTDDGGFGELE